MKFKHLLFGVLAFATVPCLHAQDDNYLHVRTADAVYIYDINDVSRISFTADKMQIAMKDEAKPEVAIARAELTSMGMDESSSAVDAIAAEAASTIAYDFNSKMVTVAADCDFEIYSTAGQLIYAVPEVKAGEKISLAAIHPGVVIIKAGSDSLKIVL